MAFWDELQPASYRGIPFGVTGGEIKFGRRNAVHEYPLRDEVWVEDMGRSARRITLSGFLVEDSLVYGGGSVIEQRDVLIDACEFPGDGELVHPTLGRMTVSLLDASAGEQWDNGRVFEIKFSFIVGGKRIFPGISTSTGDVVNAACTAADAAATSDFNIPASTALLSGASVVGQVVSTATAWAHQAQGLANDATNLYRMASSLQGSYGRYFSGRLTGFGNAPQSIISATTSVRSLIALGSVARSNVAAAASSLTSIASNLGL